MNPPRIELTASVTLDTLLEAAFAIIETCPTGYLSGYYADRFEQCSKEIRTRLEEAKNKPHQ